MAWDETIPEIVRAITDDLDDTALKVSDDNILRVIIVAAFQVNNELDFVNTYTIDILNQTISPDPTDTDSLDDAFVNLVSVKSACIINRGSAETAANRAIAVRDAGSAVDLRGVFSAKLSLIKQGWCAVYENDKFEYSLSGINNAIGAMIIGPFRLYAREGFDNSGYDRSPYKY